MADKITLDTEEDYQKIQAELNAGKKPSKTLRYMMQALENYRQSRKMGWSRPWNKYNVTNFQSFKLNSTDLALQKLTFSVLEKEIQDMPEEAQRFVTELLNATQVPMGYVFVQEFSGQDGSYEGAIASYGRMNADNKRYRDRLDVILESAVVDGVSQGLSRIRVYVDPYRGNTGPLWQCVIEQPKSTEAVSLFEELADVSWRWASDKNRVWQHWVTQYIDYFGDRQWPMKKSYFYVAGHPEYRLVAKGVLSNAA
ncbi:MAG: hypothetical protein WC782_03625 [Methylococcaceae bacterium]|jgi:hypothetical protein